jgi:hypothetical protein
VIKPQPSAFDKDKIIPLYPFNPLFDMTGPVLLLYAPPKKVVPVDPIGF